jgi:hypothetical protein
MPNNLYWKQVKKAPNLFGAFYAIKPASGHNPFAWTNLAASLLE